MGVLLSYSLQASVLMILLFAVYKALLSSTTFHSFKRFTLLSILLVSWLIPLSVPQKQLPAEKPLTTDSRVEPISQSGNGTVEIGFPIEIKDVVPDNHDVVDNGIVKYVIIIVYLTGICLVALFTLISVARLLWIIKNATLRKVLGTKVLISNHATGPFSWLGYVVIRPEDCDDNMSLVIRHELCHLRRRHWCDTLLAQINIIVTWFNPVSYLILRELKNIHEYEADRAIKPGQTRRYQLMLIKKAVGSGFPTLANSLNHSQIKIRITMMKKSKSNSARRLAALVLPGAAVAGLFLLSQPAVARVLDFVSASDSTEEFDGKVSQIQSENQIVDAVDTFVATSAAASDANSVIQELATDKSEETTPVLLVTGEEPVSQEILKEAPVYFVNGKLFTEPITSINPADIKSMTVVKNDPEYPQGKIMIELEGEDYVFTATEDIAKFGGGMPALMDFLSQNIKYPEGLKSPERVIVQFVINSEGNVEDCNIMRSGGAEADAEALRVVKLTSGKWSPAQNGGKKVSSKFVLPINFKPTQE